MAQLGNLLVSLLKVLLKLCIYNSHSPGKGDSMTTTGEVAGIPAIDSEKILTFPKGIPGFEKYTTYLVYHKEENDISAYWLESCDEPKVTFTLVDPGQYGLCYDMELSDPELEVLQAEGSEELAVFMVLSKKESDSGSTLNANIAGPVIINARTRIGMQKVIVRPRVDTIIAQEK